MNIFIIKIPHSLFFTIINPMAKTFRPNTYLHEEKKKQTKLYALHNHSINNYHPAIRNNLDEHNIRMNTFA